MRNSRWSGTRAASLGGLILLGSSATALAQPGARPVSAVCTESPEQASSRTRKPRQVSGTIIDMKTVAVRGSGIENLVVLLRTNKGDRRLVVDLGPTDRIAPANLAQNRRIAVEGLVKNVGAYTVLIAQRIKVDNRMVHIDRARGEANPPNVQYATPHAAPTEGAAPPSYAPPPQPVPAAGQPASMPVAPPPPYAPPPPHPQYPPPPSTHPGAGSPPGYY